MLGVEPDQPSPKRVRSAPAGDPAALERMLREQLANARRARL
jgi:hypothetical protein